MKRPTTIVPAVLLTALLTGCAVTKDLTAASQPSDEATGTTGTTSAEVTTTTTDDTATTAEAAAAGTTAEELLADNLTNVRSSLDYDEDSVVDVALTGDGATSDGAGVSIDGSVVTITAPGTYRITGTLSDGQLVVDSAADGLVQLILAGADLSSSTTSPLVVTDADEVAVILAEGTTSTLVDASEYQYPDAETDEPNAALFSTADLTIGGTGTLQVTGNSNDGIASKDGLVIAGGTITVTAVDDGIRGKDYLVIDDGQVRVDAGGDGLKSDNDEDATAGYVALLGGTVDITAGDDGATAATDVLIVDGTLTVVAGAGDSSADTSARGLLADVALAIAGGTVDIDAADDALHSNGITTITGGTVTLAAGDDGVHADTDLTIAGGDLEVTESYEGLESADMTIAGGDITITARDDGVNLAGGDGSAAAGPGDQADDFGDRPGGGRGGGTGGFEEVGDYHLAITGGQLVIDSGGDGLDSNGTATMSGGTVVVQGPTSNGNGAIDVNGTFDITGGTLVAAGSAGMAETPEATSAQAWLAATFQSTQPAGSVIAFEANGTVLATFTASKQIQSIVLSTPDLETGASYDVYIDATPEGADIGGLSDSGSTSGATHVGSVAATGA